LQSFPSGMVWVLYLVRIVNSDEFVKNPVHQVFGVWDWV